jgi:hypothetical protein
MATAIQSFEDRMFFGSTNRFVGSGGEILIKDDPQGPPGRMDVGDRLMGIGATHMIENLDVAPGPDSFHSTSMESDFQVKSALRAIEVTAKEETDEGYDFSFRALTPQAYSEILEGLSEGTVRIPPDKVPDGTIILSFVDSSPDYTLGAVAGSPGANFVAATKGERHWNVGLGKEDDFWAASFPSDDVGLLTKMPRTMMVGTIRFGLSLLPDSNTTVRLKPVPCIGPSGRESEHDFCLDGMASGTQAIATPFPIGVQTQIRFRPIR